MIEKPGNRTQDIDLIKTNSSFAGDFRNTPFRGTSVTANGLNVGVGSYSGDKYLQHWDGDDGEKGVRMLEMFALTDYGIEKNIWAPIGSIAGGIPSTFAGAENAAMDGKTSDTVEGIISSGATKGVVLAEASLQALSKLARIHQQGGGLHREESELQHTGSNTESALEFPGPSSHEHATRLLFKLVAVTEAAL
ncbi:ATP synthase f1 [Colletotrichum kahawae]|uniref:ATP synthase f1 n=1 Tax=Colletotrichum kahawae TaxID=34407 RepID=A0AAD9YPT2_COLKA|nr:ATP synthase f1 [Colletotrichum kahawae]